MSTENMLRVMGGLQGYVICRPHGAAGTYACKANFYPDYEWTIWSWSGKHLAYNNNDGGWSHLMKRKKAECAIRIDYEDVLKIQEAYEQWGIDLEDKISGRK